MWRKESGSLFSVAQISPEQLATGYLIALTGSLALHVGIEWRRPLIELSSSQEDEQQGNQQYKLIFMIVLWALGIVQAFRPEWFNMLGVLFQPIQRSSTAVVCFIALSYSARLGLSATNHKILLVVGTIGLLLANLQTGSKAYVMYAFFPLFWMAIVQRSLRRWIPLISLGLALFYLLIVAPIITTSRHIREGSDEGTITLLLRSYDYVSQTDDMTFQDRALAYLERQFDPAPIGFLVGDVEENGFRHGETMEYATYAFIPRLLWPDKPGVTRGGWFATYLGFSDGVNRITSIGITAAGELYWNFGLLGVTLGMSLIGVMIGGLWHMASANPTSSITQMMLYTTIMLNMPDMAEAVTAVLTLTALYLIYGTTLFVLRVFRKNQKGNHVIIST